MNNTAEDERQARMQSRPKVARMGRLCFAEVQWGVLVVLEVLADAGGHGTRCVHAHVVYFRRVQADERWRHDGIDTVEKWQLVDMGMASARGSGIVRVLKTRM